MKNEKSKLRTNKNFNFYCYKRLLEKEIGMKCRCLNLKICQTTFGIFLKRPKQGQEELKARKRVCQVRQLLCHYRTSNTLRDHQTNVET